jgi:hypothetical protein
MTEPLDPEPFYHLSISVLQNNDASPENNDDGSLPKKNHDASPKNMNRSCFSHVRKKHKYGGPHTTQTVVKPRQKIRLVEPVRFRERRYSDGQEYRNKQRGVSTHSLF